MQDALNEMQRLLTDISDEPETYSSKPAKSPKSPGGGSRSGGRRAALVDVMSESIDILKSSVDEDDSDNDTERDSDGLRCSFSLLP